MDTIDLSRFIFSFLLVIGLIALLGVFLKRYGGAAKMFGAQAEGKRLHVLETRYLDPKRRLVLIRRDDQEHLLLLSDGRDMVIESTKEHHA